MQVHAQILVPKTGTQMHRSPIHPEVKSSISFALRAAVFVFKLLDKFEKSALNDLKMN